MKKEYSAPELSAEMIYITDSMCVSYTKEDCIKIDNVTDTFSSGNGGGYVYMNGGLPYYCLGLGDF